MIRRSFARIDVKNFAKIYAVGVEALEKERSSVSMTQQIRDSGCALIWFLSRNGPSIDLLNTFLCPLVNVALFERDINLRRAAAAALQELVGRVGTIMFPQGLDLISVVDFWSVSDLESCFTVLPEKLLNAIPVSDALHHQLRVSMSNHLENEKMFKSTSSLATLASRRMQLLAAQGLAHLRSSDDQLIDRMCLIGVSEEKEWHERLSSIVFLTHVLKQSLHARTALSNASQKGIRNLVPLIDKRRLFRGRGGDLIRSACYDTLGVIFEVHQEGLMEFKEEQKFFLKSIQLLAEGAVHLVDHVQVCAIKSLMLANNTASELVQTIIVDPFLEKLESNTDVNIAARRGMILAVGLLSERKSEKTFQLLRKEVLAWPSHFLCRDFVDPSARVNAILGITKFALNNEGFAQSAVECLLSGLEDFQTDKRGDVGSWVRMKAVDALAYVSSKWENVDREKITLSLIAHAGERLDRVRERCVTRLELFGKSDLRDLTKEVFHPYTVNLGDDHSTCMFPLVNLLAQRFSDYGDPFEGIMGMMSYFANDSEKLAVLSSQLMVAVGGTTPNPVAEKSVRNSTLDKREAFIGGIFTYITRKNLRVQSIGDTLNRILAPAITSLSLVVTDKHQFMIEEVIHHGFIEAIVGIEENMTAVRAISRLYSRFVMSNQQLGRFFAGTVLGSPFPRIRFAGAQDLVLNCDDEGIVDIVERTDWLGNHWVENLREIGDILTFGELSITSDNTAALVVKKAPKLKQPLYAEFISENYRYS
jgi:hypothetical protein